MTLTSCAVYSLASAVLVAAAVQAQNPIRVFGCEADVIVQNPQYLDWSTCSADPTELETVTTGGRTVRQYVPELNNQHMGAEITFGDWNGDGEIDAVLSGKRNPDRENAFSSVWIYLGPLSPQRFASTPLTIIGDGDADQFGDQTAFVNDLNGDGRQELFVTAPNWPNDIVPLGPPDESYRDSRGRVLVFFGEDEQGFSIGERRCIECDAGCSDPDSVCQAGPPDLIIEGAETGARFGSSILFSETFFAGDQDLVTPECEGCEGALFIGEPGSYQRDLAIPGTPFGGRVYVISEARLLAAVSAGTALLRVQDLSPGIDYFLIEEDATLTPADNDERDRFGFSLALLGDVEPIDGRSEIAIGATEILPLDIETGRLATFIADEGLLQYSTGSGYVSIVSADAVGVPVVTSALTSSHTDVDGEGEAFGYSMATRSLFEERLSDLVDPSFDFDDDGVADLIVGAPCTTERRTWAARRIAS